MNLELLPRFVNYTDNKFIFDEIKLKVNKSIEDDKLLLKNIISGKIISSEIYPLIYDCETEEVEIKYRSIPFYLKVIEDINLYINLTDDNKIIFNIGLRDLFIAQERNLLHDAEINILNNIVNLIHDNFIKISVEGMSLTPNPTSENKLVKFTESIEFTDPVLEQYFVKNNLGMLMVFVDPQELSYHNFENIIHLDKYIKTFKSINFSFDNVHKYKNKDIFVLDLLGSNDLLLKLNDLDLYTIPLNKSSRGGKRFIFNSKLLSEELSSAFKGCKGLNGLKKNFKFINNVFRYNKFVPSDNKFISHFDTPYYDSSKEFCSKYTIIIYLTSGNGEGVLKIDDICINSIKNFTAIIFNQKYEHEGKAFIDNDKIFIRSELIYYDPNLDHNIEVAKLFNISCYTTKESMFNKELSNYSNKTFNQVAQIRNNLKYDKEEILLIHKWLNDINFVTNGNDYWFNKKLNLKQIALIIILDYFNGKHKDIYFTKVLKSEIINSKLSCNDIYLLLSDNQKKNNYNSLDFESKYKLKNKSKLENLKEGEMCCDFHHGHFDDNGFDPFYCNDVRHIYNNHLPNYELEQCSVIILGNKLMINTDDIEIKDNKIVFNNTGTMSRVNFAACWNSDNSPSNYVSLVEQDLKTFNLPYIPFIEEKLGYHLTIDMFNNDFIIKDDHHIIVPKITKNPDWEEIRLRDKQYEKEDYANKIREKYSFKSDSDEDDETPN